MTGGRMLVRALRNPHWAERLDPGSWTDLIAAARAEALAGSLAERLAQLDMDIAIRSVLDDIRSDFAQARVQALWEAEMARRAIAPLGVPMVLLKGTAFAAAGLDAAVGRSIGDLDILVPRRAIERVEEALLAAGWERVKEPEGYDDLYYRRWMHELPPLVHKQRDRMIDVHHTILPLTARPRPDPARLIERSLVLDNGLRVLAPADMVIHAAAHLLADGDMAGGLRNLWDIDRLLREFGRRRGFWSDLGAEARRHQLLAAVSRSLRLAARLYGTSVDDALAGPRRGSDRFFVRRLLARNGWGQPTRPLLRFGFYLRGHWLRMPPLMLARHLLVKARG